MTAALLMTTVLLTLVAVQEWRHGVVPWVGHVPSFLKIQDPVVQRVLEGSARAATGIHRIQATYTTSLGFAEFLALMRSDEHTSELQSLMRISYAVFCLKKKQNTK